MGKVRTPIIKPRTQGGTFYTFSSALEDVGLNINELKNKVSLSHYVLLNIPSFAVESFDDGVNPGDYTFAQHFQNYALNMETVLRNQSDYNFAEAATVSERVFWKWMQKEGFIEFKKDISGEEETGYYIDKNTFTEDSVIKGFGFISAGAQRTDAYGVYNETFVQIPSTYGQMKVLLKPISDKNYYITNDNPFKSPDESDYIENIDASTECDESGKLHTGISALAEFDDDTNKTYIVADETDELCVEFSLSELRKYYDDETLTYDNLGVGQNGWPEGKDITLPDNFGDFEFNSILVYYSIYDSTGKNILATNAYGLLLLESAKPDGDISGSNSYKYPSLPKKQSGKNDAGSSYSFRLNIKTSSVYNGDIKVTDNSTPGYAMSEDFNDTIRNLAVAVDTLRSNANLISVLCDQSSSIKDLVVRSLDKIDDIEKDIITLKTGKVKELKTSLLITDALSANNLDSSLKIDDYGAFDGSVFSYENIQASNGDVSTLTVDKLNVINIEGPNQEVLFGEYGKFSSNGVFANTLYLNSKTSEADDMNIIEANSIIKSLYPKKDGTIIINTSDAALTPTSNNIGLVPSNSEAADGTILNIKPLLASIIKKLQTLELFDISTVDSSTEVLQNIYDIINEVHSDYAELESRVSQLETSSSELSDLCSSIELDIDAIDSSLSSLSNTVDNHELYFTDISTELSAIDDRLTEAESFDTSINAKVDYLYDYLAGIEDIIERIND